MDDWVPKLTTEERQRILDDYRQRWIEDELSRIPRRFRNDLTGEPAKAVEGWVDEILAGGTDGLLILGNVGRGKTSAAYWAFRRLRERDWKGTFASFTSTEWLECRRPDGDAEEGRLAYDVDLLMIDDLGAESRTGWTLDQLTAMFDKRYANMLPTIVTTNVPIKDFGEILGNRLASRVNGSCRRLVLTGEDRRNG